MSSQADKAVGYLAKYLAKSSAEEPTARVIDRTCFRCLAEFGTASTDRRVYCPACVAAYGFPAPSIPQTGIETGREVA